MGRAGGVRRREDEQADRAGDFATRSESARVLGDRTRSGLPGGRTRAGAMIRKLASGEYRLYSRKKNPKTGKRRNLGTFKSRDAAMKHERAVQFFKRQ